MAVRTLRILYVYKTLFQFCQCIILFLNSLHFPLNLFCAHLSLSVHSNWSNFPPLIRLSRLALSMAADGMKDRPFIFLFLSRPPAQGSKAQGEKGLKSHAERERKSHREKKKTREDDEQCGRVNHKSTERGCRIQTSEQTHRNTVTHLLLVYFNITNNLSNTL